MKKKIDKDKRYRIIALALLFFAQGGLDIKSIWNIDVPMSAVFMVILGIYASIKVKFNVHELLICSTSFFSLWTIYIIKGAPMPFWVGTTVISAYFVLSIYKSCPEEFLPDLSTLCKWYMYYTLAGIVMQFTMSSMIQQSSFYRYKSILGIFWYCRGDNIGGYRFTGLGGEPGIWQFFLSLNLLFALYEKRSPQNLILSVLSIVFMFSTTGYFIMLFILGFYYTVIDRKIRLQYLLAIGLLGFLLAGFVFQGIMDKLSNSSGLTRISDIYIGWMFIRRSPLLGVDPDIANFSSDSEFIKLKYEVWGDNNYGYIDQGYVDSGFCSGIMIFLLDYGLPLAFYYLYKMFKFPLIQNKQLKFGVLAIILLTFMTEPQSRTSWFYFFVLAKFIKFNWKKSKICI